MTSSFVLSGFFERFLRKIANMSAVLSEMQIRRKGGGEEEGDS